MNITFFSVYQVSLGLAMKHLIIWHWMETVPHCVSICNATLSFIPNNSFLTAVLQYSLANKWKSSFKFSFLLIRCDKLMCFSSNQTQCVFILKTDMLMNPITTTTYISQLTDTQSTYSIYCIYCGIYMCTNKLKWMDSYFL